MLLDVHGGGSGGVATRTVRRRHLRNHGNRNGSLRTGTGIAPGRENVVPDPMATDNETKPTSAMDDDAVDGNRLNVIRNGSALGQGLGLGLLLTSHVKNARSGNKAVSAYGSGIGCYGGSHNQGSSRSSSSSSSTTTTGGSS